MESGGDNLAATFSPELADLTIYVIDRRSRREDSAQRAGRGSRARICSSSNKDRSRSGMSARIFR